MKHNINNSKPAAEALVQQIVEDFRKMCPDFFVWPENEQIVVVGEFCPLPRPEEPGTKN